MGGAVSIWLRLLLTSWKKQKDLIYVFLCHLVFTTTDAGVYVNSEYTSVSHVPLSNIWLMMRQDTGRGTEVNTLMNVWGHGSGEASLCVCGTSVEGLTMVMGFTHR